MEWTISLALARLLLAEAEFNLIGKTKVDTSGLMELLEWMERQKQTMQTRGWSYWEIQLCVIECLTRRALGDKPGTLAALRHALELAAPDGFVRIFVEEGERLRKVLVELEKDGGRLLPYLHKLQLAFPDTTGRLSAPPGTGERLVEPISQRELEVLHLISLGKTNQEVARQLIVAPGTVKAHTASIYRKLDVSNRTEAVARARQLGILP